MPLAGRGHDRDRHRHVAAARPGPDGQADVRPAELAGPSRIADEVVGRCLVGRIGGRRAPGRGRTRGRTRGPSRPGPRRRSIRRSAATRRRRTTPRCSHRCRSRPPRASSRARRGGRRSRRSRSSRPSPRRSRRACSSTTAGRRFDERLGRHRLDRDGRDPDVDRLDPGVRGDDRIGRPEHRLAEQLGDLRLADPGQPVRPGRDRRSQAERLEAGHGLVGPHRAHLARRTGQRDDDAPVGPADEPARRGAVRVGQRDGRPDQPGLLEVELGEGHVAPPPQLAQPRLEVRIGFRRLVAHGGDRLAGQVVRGRTEAAGRDDQVRPLERRGEGIGDRDEVVGQRGQPGHPDAETGQRASDLPGVRVARLADRRARCRCSAARPSGVAARPHRTCPAAYRDALPATGRARCAAIIAADPRIRSRSRSTPLDDQIPTDPPPRTPPPPPPPPSSRGPRVPPPGLRAQLGATRDAAMALVVAHIDLAKAEAGAIAGEVGRVIALGALAFILVVFAVFLLVIGLSLFVGEWLLGSMGWGVLHGILLFVSVAMAALLLAVGIAAEPDRALAGHRDRHRHRRRGRPRAEPAKPAVCADRRPARRRGGAGCPAAGRRRRARPAHRAHRRHRGRPSG